MPVQVIKYRCEYGCKRVLASKSAIAKHEDTCWNNAETKTCVTCNNGETLHTPFIERVCSHEVGKLLLEKTEVIAQTDIKKPVINCPYYTIKEL